MGFPINLFGRRDESIELEGTITHLRVVEGDGERPRWILRVDADPSRRFEYVVSPLSKVRRVGDMVRLGYRARDAGRDPVPVQWLTSADGAGSTAGAGEGAGAAGR